MGGLHETSQAIGRLQASVEKLEHAVARLSERIEELQRLRWLMVGALVVLCSISGASSGWLAKFLDVGT
ncbi:hypothetical protein [Dongia rigui]|uniref:Uncharacterized protein n=1 Tax=Dongia rigui TaxID=940149 RepID=A0ABU5E125_9PROT|nr:hypothetical protein [Dongia rigui]MDY0872521.1 hypothetical protein [Dongia rigui]